MQVAGLSKRLAAYESAHPVWFAFWTALIMAAGYTILVGGTGRLDLTFVVFILWFGGRASIGITRQRARQVLIAEGEHPPAS